MYIGKTPTVGNFQVCDAISVVNGQAAYTLQVGGVNVAPESANHMLVSLNGILQKPGSSFTISGSTMTFASNLATGDVIDFVQILGNVLDIGQPSDDTVTAAKLNNDIISGQTALTSSPDDTDELLISDAGTIKRIDVSLVGGKNTPNFFLNASASHDISNATSTVVQYDTSVYDTDSATGSNGFTVPSGKGGKYYIFARLMGQFFDASGEYVDLSIFEGSTKKITQRSGGYNAGGDRNIAEITGVVNVSAGSLLTVRLYHTMGSARGFDTDTLYTYFGGFKLIE
jgi:hypothetical protein